MTEDFIAAITWLKARPESTGRFGVVGFCFGGGISNTLAVRMPDLAAAVPFYGGRAGGGRRAEDQGGRARAPRRARHAAVQAWPAYEEALKANKIRLQGYVYPKANHGFHNDTTPRYDEAAAKLAWQRTLD